MVWLRGAQIKLTINNCDHTKAEIAFIFTKLNITLQESRFQEILTKNRRKKKNYKRSCYFAYCLTINRSIFRQLLIVLSHFSWYFTDVMWMIDLSTAKPLLHFTLHVLADLMSAATEDQVTKTKLILYQSISDVVQITINIFPVYIHYPGKQKEKSILLVRDVSTQNEKRKKKFDLIGMPPSPLPCRLKRLRSCLVPYSKIFCAGPDDRVYECIIRKDITQFE